MYYQNNDDYMRDFFYFNQNPNMNNMGWGYMPNNMGNINGMNNTGYMQNNNLESLYPNIYRILQPVVRRVVANSNYQYLTEEVLNNMVDTVYNIVEGDRSLNTIETSSRPENTTATENARRNSNTSSSSNSNNSNTTTNLQSRNNEMNNNNNLLKDLIKILILQEIARNNTRRNFNSMNSNINQNMKPNQYTQDCCNQMRYM